MRALVLAAVLVAAASGLRAQPLPSDLPLAQQAPDSFLVVVQTTKGRFVMKAHRVWAPRGVDRLYQLARSGYYNNNRIFRVGSTISYPGGLVVQFGLSNDPKVNAVWAAAPIPDEPVRQKHARGMVTYSLEVANTRTVELAIDLTPNTGLDTVHFRGAVGFPVVAQVVEGMDVLDRLNRRHGNTPRDNRDSIMAKGSEYLDRVFPDLDRIRAAYVTTEWRTPQGWVENAEDAKLAAWLDAVAAQPFDSTDRERPRRLLRELPSVADHRRLSPDAKLNYRMFEEAQRSRLAWLEFRHLGYYFTRTPFDPYVNAAQQIIAGALITDAVTLKVYLDRLHGLRRVLEDALANTLERQKRGIVLPAFNFGDIARNASVYARGEPCDAGPAVHPLWADARRKASVLPEALRAVALPLLSAAIRDSVCTAYAAFASRFTELGAGVSRVAGVWTLPHGDSLYRLAVRYHTTLDVDPEEIHAIGLREVARIEDELRRIMATAGGAKTTREFFETIRRDPRFVVPDTPVGRDSQLAVARAVIARVEKALPRFFKQLPQQSVVVKPVESHREAALGSAAFYQPASAPGEPATFYMGLLRPSARPLWAIEALTCHEAIPGHHLQIALAAERQGPSRFRENVPNGAFLDGWALYAEGLCAEMGGYKDDYSRAGLLDAELTRAIRLVVESGVHHKRWSWDQAAQYWAEHRGTSLESARQEVTRYINWPGQGVQYKLGHLEILRLRRKAETELGSRFDIREFHAEILENGEVPFVVLREMVDQWIARKKQ